MIWIGTSGFQYREWKGSFYPETLSAAKMLSFYSQQFPTTEINYTFRQLPSDAVLANWKAQTPARFRFTLKAPRVITEFRRLKNCGKFLDDFLEVAGKLGSKHGALLFQLPPTFKCDVPVLEDFLALFGREAATAAFEFRHESWFCDPVYAVLRRRKAMLCIAESETTVTPPVVTGSSVYFRLRRDGYSPAQLRAWSRVIRDAADRCKQVYIYFKHEETGMGPRLARDLGAMLKRTANAK